MIASMRDAMIETRLKLMNKCMMVFEERAVDIFAEWRAKEAGMEWGADPERIAKTTVTGLRC